jgi:hypothetical protein
MKICYRRSAAMLLNLTFPAKGFGKAGKNSNGKLACSSHH